MATMYMGNQQITPAFVVNSDKYGVSVDAFLGDVDANGVLQLPAAGGSVVLHGVTDIADGAFAYKFMFNAGINGFSAPVLVAISGTDACHNTFSGCANLVSASMPELVTIGSLDSNESCWGMFDSTGLITVSFLKLKTIDGTDSCVRMFANCKSLTDVYFYSLTSVSADAFEDMFLGAGASTGLTVHFPSNAETLIQGLTGYPTFGADSDIITLAYDLPATAE